MLVAPFVFAARHCSPLISANFFSFEVTQARIGDGGTAQSGNALTVVREAAASAEFLRKSRRVLDIIDSVLR
jgi:hypothetical protein